jgi:SAM-dependent methyltransferase
MTAVGSASFDAPVTSTRAEVLRLVSTRIREIAGSRPLEILEAGCGRKWPIDLRGVSFRLTGVDLDKDALESRKNGVGDLDDAIVGDLLAVEFPPERFDVVYSAFVLEHIKGAERLLEKFVSWLRPGGLLVIEVPDRDSVYGFVTRITPFWVHVLYHKHFTDYYRRNGMAGRPGYGPYPTFHDKIIARPQFRRFIAEHGFARLEEYPFWRLPAVQQKLTDLISLLTFGKLDSSHINVCYIAQRPPRRQPPDDVSASGGTLGEPRA